MVEKGKELQQQAKWLYEVRVVLKLCMCPETPGGGMIELDIPSLISTQKPRPIYRGFRPAD